jgi:hypothetical protein
VENFLKGIDVATTATFFHQFSPLTPALLGGLADEADSFFLQVKSPLRGQPSLNPRKPRAAPQSFIFATPSDRRASLTQNFAGANSQADWPDHAR